MSALDTLRWSNHAVPVKLTGCFTATLGTLYSPIFRVPVVCALPMLETLITPDRQSLLGLHQQSWWFNVINYTGSNNFVIKDENDGIKAALHYSCNACSK